MNAALTDEELTTLVPLFDHDAMRSYLSMLDHLAAGATEFRPGDVRLLLHSVPGMLVAAEGMGYDRGAGQRAAVVCARPDCRDQTSINDTGKPHNPFWTYQASGNAWNAWTSGGWFCAQHGRTS